MPDYPPLPQRPRDRASQTADAVPPTGAARKIGLVLILLCLTLWLPPEQTVAQTPAPQNAAEAQAAQAFEDIFGVDEETDEAGEDQNAAPTLFGATLKMLAALAFTLGLILLVSWIAKKYTPTTQRGISGPDAIDIMSVRALGPRRSLMVVRVRGRNFLLGSTPSAITRLADLDMPPGAEGEANDTDAFNAELSAAIRNR